MTSTIATSHRWDRQGFLDAPTRLKSLSECCRMDLEMARPFGDCFGDSVERKASGSSSVATLFTDIRPATIARLVRSVVVDSVEGAVSRSFSHIGEEGIETLPASAHDDAATSVLGPFLAIPVTAPAPHFDPAAVGLGLSITHHLNYLVTRQVGRK